MEAELDRAEVFLKLNPDDLIGEVLLKSHYSLHNDSRSKSRIGMDQMNESIFISRAITPSNLRQSMMFQSKQLDVSESIASTNKEGPPPTNPRNLTAKIDRPSETLKASKNNHSNQRSNSNDRKPSFRQRNNTDDDKNKKVNILVLDSNDASSNNSNIEEVIQSPHYPPPHPIQQRSSLKESSNVFASKPKIQRTPEQSYAIDRRKSNSTSVNQSGSLIIPKYSVSEPRPSSANSTRSKNSSSSGHSNQNDNSVYNGIKKK